MICERDDAFWIVWDMKHISTITQYKSQHDAYAAAEATALANPGMEIYVMRAMEKYYLPLQQVVKTELIAGR